MQGIYREDLAFIHDNGFSAYARSMAPGIVALLQRSGISSGQIVELGCGSGVLTKELMRAGYSVHGIDVSSEMLLIAAGRAPKATLEIGSIYNVKLTPCRAVVSVGEVLNYITNPRDKQRALDTLFARVYRALEPGGLFIFDLASPGQLDGRLNTFMEGEGWAMLLEKWEEPEEALLWRRIVTFRRVGEHWRRDSEEHLQRLHSVNAISARLRSAGFSVQSRRSSEEHPLPHANALIIARRH